MNRAGTINSQRLDRLREKVLIAPEVCLERAYWMTESYKETEGEPYVIRRAKALAKVLGNIPVHIDDDELIVGRVTSKRRGAALTPEVTWTWYLEEMDSISTREWDRFSPLTDEEKRRMQEFLPYWQGRSLYEKWCEYIPDSVRGANNKTFLQSSCPINNIHLAHDSPDYEKVIRSGLNSIKEQVDKRLAELDLRTTKDFEKYHFLKAVNISIEAAVDFAKRYADLATDMADQETSAPRKAELEKIAEMCSWVPVNPPRSFHEALEAAWLVYIVLMNEGWGPGIGFGRMDQYLYPFYKRDIEEGRLTREEARELIGLFYIKLNEIPQTLFSEVFVRNQSGSPQLSNITLGGLNEAGEDAVNELSYIFLDAEEDVRLHAEDLVIRVSKHNPESFLVRACELARLMRGKFKFVSDSTAIRQLVHDGKPLQSARNYVVAGCFTLTVPAISQDLGTDYLNLPMMLELALNNGVSRLTGEQLGPQTGDPHQFKSYDEVWNAYCKQVEAMVRSTIPGKVAYRRIYAMYAPTPFQSALFDGCIEKGRDITDGGPTPFITCGTWAAGAPNVGDSLAAIKKAVFEDKKIGMDKLIEVLDKNFADETEVLHLLSKAPKYGNDDDYVDSIVDEVLKQASSEVAKYETIPGAKSTMAAALVTTNVPLGKVVGALPDGRKAREPLSEGGLSPYQGRNVSGPSATMRSVAKLDHLNFTNGSVLNMRFSPDVLKDESKLKKFASLIKTFCETGGYLVQFNIVSSDTLKEAQKYPEKHRDLLIRVATYSAYFVELSPELQEDIIARMEFTEV